MAYYFDRINSLSRLLVQQKNLIKIILRNAFRPVPLLLMLTLLLLSCSEAVGGTYYVDPENGDDSYSGRAAVYEGGDAGPWKSISRVNEQAFLPGDSILFKRGGVWTDGPLEPRTGGEPGGTITIKDSVVGRPLRFDLVDPQNNNCIYFGAYGDHPAKPRIDCNGGRGIILQHNYIIVEDIHLDNGDNNVLWLARENGTSWVIINRVDVTNSAANAVRSSFGGGHIWLKGLYVYNYGVNGILLNGSATNKLQCVLVEDCWVENPEVLELEDAITCHRDQEDNDLAGNIIIRNNTTLRAGEDGIDITTGSNILLEGNVTKFSHAGGIYVNFDWVNHVEVRGNFIYGNSISKGYGDLTIRAPMVRVVNNIVAGPGHHCVLVGNTDQTQFWNNVIAPGNRTGNLIWLREGIGQVEFKNNIFDFSRTEQDISGEIPHGMVFDNNCYYGMDRSQDIYENMPFQEVKDSLPEFEPNGIWGNPRFIHPERSEPEHFRIGLNSPCRDAGAYLPLQEDYWGTPRPQGNGPDIGAHEVVSKAPEGPGWISGRAWDDQNGDCTPGAGEPGLDRLAIDLYGPDGRLLALKYTHSGGRFRFDGLQPGTYRLRASMANFHAGRPFEKMEMACLPEEKQLFQSVTIGSDQPGSEANLGLRARTAPPVVLSEFTAKKEGDRVRLSWSTTLEKGIAYFEIERSNDGRSFFSRGQIKSRSNTDGGQQTYYFIDEDPPGRLAYYRLKQMEKDGRLSYSPWRLANMRQQDGRIEVSPTRFSDELKITLSDGATADKAWVINQQGERVYENSLKGQSQDISLGLGSLPAGAYYLIIRSDQKRRIRTAIPIVKE